MYELIIVGAGPAGITAAIYAARKKMDFIVITKDVGGQAAWSGDISNYTGFQLITGAELMMKFEEHLKNYKVNILEGVEVQSIQNDAGIFTVKTPKNDYNSKTVIIATGKKSKELGIPGEAEFKNKGVAYCTTCDGPLFANKAVAVIGGGNSAMDSALQLEKIAKSVYLLNINKELKGDEVFKEKISKSKKIKVLNETTTQEIIGSSFVQSIKFTNGGSIQTLPVDGVFVEIGLLPNSAFINGVEKNEYGEIIINCQAKTSLPGMFACGDVTSVFSKQVIIAAGDGAKAALSAYNYLLNTPN